MEPESPSPYPQVPATSPYPEPRELEVQLHVFVTLRCHPFILEKVPPVPNEQEGVWANTSSGNTEEFRKLVPLPGIKPGSFIP